MYITESKQTERWAILDLPFYHSPPATAPVSPYADFTNFTILARAPPSQLPMLPFYHFYQFYRFTNFTAYRFSALPPYWSFHVNIRLGDHSGFTICHFTDLTILARPRLSIYSFYHFTILSILPFGYFALLPFLPILPLFASARTSYYYQSGPGTLHPLLNVFRFTFSIKNKRAANTGK